MDRLSVNGKDAVSRDNELHPRGHRPRSAAGPGPPPGWPAPAINPKAGARANSQKGVSATKGLTALHVAAIHVLQIIDVYLTQGALRHVSGLRDCYMLAIRLPAETEERLARLAKATGRTKTFYAREAILTHLDDLEDLYLTESRLLDIRSGKTSPVPLENVLKDYGMEG